MKAEVLAILSLQVSEAAGRALEDGGVASSLVDRMVERDIDPHGAAAELARELDL
jgi:hypothetical protein